MIELTPDERRACLDLGPTVRRRTSASLEQIGLADLATDPTIIEVRPPARTLLNAMLMSAAMAPDPRTPGGGIDSRPRSSIGAAARAQRKRWRKAQARARRRNRR